VADEQERQARIELAAAHQIAALDGLAEGTWNHFSLMLPGEPPRMLITPGDRHWTQVTASSLAAVGGDPGTAREEGGQFWVGYRIHHPVHAARPAAEAACMLHTHSPYAVALSLLGPDALLTASQMSADFHGRIAYNERYDGLEGESERQGEAIAEALGDKDVLLLRGHGAVVVGPTVAQAYLDAYVLELACRTQLLAMSSGRQPRPFTPAEAEELAARADDGGREARRHFGAMRALLDARGSTYAD
jgi:ribulose-5-phosphate 4-epimerase/fuculose-1-phosphate aldolase